jgi:hypothetical protein
MSKSFSSKHDLPAEYVVCDECDEIVPRNEIHEHACELADFDHVRAMDGMPQSA